MTHGTPTPDDEDDVPDRFVVDFSGLDLLGHVHVDERVADGGMGSIYLGRDTNLDRRVVIKVPHARFLGEPGFRARFRREIEELVRLEHPHVVRILAQGVHEDVPFFVLQYLGGGSLEDVLARREGPGTVEQVEDWLPVIADTLDFVHARGTVHRDVKPANVLFDEAGHVFLSDFGVAKALARDDPGLTETGSGVGSPYTMAPEQIVGEEIGPAADQYALAAMVYEALAGRPPFPGSTPLDVLVAKRTRDPTPLGDLARALPAAAAAAVMRALDRDPAARFGSCGAFARAFREACHPPAVASRPRPRTWIAAALITAAAVVAGILLVGPTAETPGPGHGPADDVGAAHLVLLDPGAAPRRPLRYAVPDGQREACRMSMEQHLTMDPAEVKIPDSAFPVEHYLFDLAVDGVEDGGDVRTTWSLREARQTSKTPVPPALQKSYAHLSKTLVGLGGSQRVTANGMLRSHAMRPKPDMPAMLRAQTERLARGLSDLTVPLPVEPVGVGARWEVTEALDAVGLRVTRTLTFELRGIDGDTLDVLMEIAQTAPKQTLHLPILQSGPSITLLSLHTVGEATTRVDLGHLLPQRSASTMKMELTTRAEGKKKEQGHMTFDLKETVERAEPPR